MTDKLTRGTFLDEVGTGGVESSIDKSTNIPVPGTIAPTSATASVPSVEKLTNVGPRQYGVRDANDRYRIW